MYSAYVKDTDLIVASTTYIEEFSKPSKAIEEKMKQIEKRYADQYDRKFQVFYIVILHRSGRALGGDLSLFPFGDWSHSSTFRGGQ